MRVYIHVPFCARRCSYCDFAIAVRRETPTAAFVDAIRAEWLLKQEHPAWGWEEGGGGGARDALQSVYFGGGTPSRLAPEGLAQILDLVCASQPLAPGAEVTLETNPDDVTPTRASAWHRLGINRVSLGVQSFEPAVLEWMHRTHTPQQVAPAVEALRAVGFDNISLDLIYGVPESVRRDWADDLGRALALAPEHLSLYALTVEAHTPLAHWRARGEVVAAPQDATAREFTVAAQQLAAAGFEHYEVSNAAKPGFRAAHNSGYWRGDSFLGIGPSAHSAWEEPGAGTAGGGGGISRQGKRRRSWNCREWEAYRSTLVEGRDPLQGSETLTESQILLEDRYLGLRTDGGVPETMIPPENLVIWEGEGWAVRSDGRVGLTLEGWLRLDSLVAQLPDDS